MKCYVMLCEMLYVKIEIISIFHEIQNITTLLYPDLFAPNLDKVEGGCMTLTILVITWSVISFKTVTMIHIL